MMAGLLSQLEVFADFSEYQAMGLTALEAASCGTAVLGPTRGGLGEILRDEATALLVDTSDETACYNALVRLVEDAALRTKLSLRALQEIVPYFPERSALRMMNALFCPAVGRIDKSRVF